MFSILILTFNNLEYLNFCIRSIKKNSKYTNQIIPHVNIGDDGTIDFLKHENIDYSYTEYNSGICEGTNKAAKLAKYNYLLYAHDDFYFCPGWDIEFVDELKKLEHKKFYLSGTMVGDGQVYFDAGKTVSDFEENKLLSNLEKIKTFNFQGTTKCPGLVHKDIWKAVGGWSEEFSPTGGDDSDFAKKLWDYDVRIFKGLGKCIAYHFGSITTRKKNKSLFTYLGSRGNKIFLLKWGMSINFFEKFYLKSGLDKNKKLIFNEFKQPLSNPVKNFSFYFELIISKFLLIYLLLNKKKYLNN